MFPPPVFSGTSQPTATPAQPRPTDDAAIAGRFDRATNVAQGWRRPVPRAGLRNVDGGYDFAALAAWETSGTPGEARALAAAVIRSAVRAGETELNLHHMQLTSVPPLPPVERLRLDGNCLESIGALPDSVRGLNCGYNAGLTRIHTLPPRLESLNCCGTALTELPALPPSMKALWIASGRPFALPDLPGGLESLYVGDVVLQRLPELPEGLRALRAPNCGLEVAPTRWPAHLRSLVLRDNRLAWVPDLPASLSLCDLSNNRLTALPGNAAALRPQLLPPLNLTGNPLPDAVVVECIELNRNLGTIVQYGQLRLDAQSPHGWRLRPPALRPGSESASAWYPAEDRAAKREAWLRVAQEPNARSFFAFLERLHGSTWRDSPAFVEQMRAWLDKLALPGNVDLRTETFTISLEANQSCHDRALRALQDMRMLAMDADVESGMYGGKPAELLALGRGYQALDAVTSATHRILAGRVAARGKDGRHEELELFLAVAQRFRALLPAGLAPDAHMRYEACADLTPAELETVERAVETLPPKFPTFLCNWTPMLKALAQWNPARHAAADARLRDKLDSDDFKPYQLEHGHVGEAAFEALRRDVFAPLVRDYLDAHGIESGWLQTASAPP